LVHGPTGLDGVSQRREASLVLARELHQPGELVFDLTEPADGLASGLEQGVRLPPKRVLDLEVQALDVRQRLLLLGRQRANLIPEIPKIPLGGAP
jgi:hypothetical protein